MRKLLVSGLIVYSLISGLGLFLDAGFFSPFVLPYLAGYLFLVFTASYSLLFSKESTPGFIYLLLGIVGLNFLVQVTGGFTSPLRPAYFLLAAAATFQPLAHAYSAAAIILFIDAENLLMSGQAFSGRWLAEAGFALSLIGVVFIITPVTRRIQNQVHIARKRYQKLLADAKAVDPLAGDMKLDALSEQGRQATNVSSAVEREGAFKGLIDIIYGLVPAHTYAVFVADRTEREFTLRAIRSENRHVAVEGTVQVSCGSGLIGICIKEKQPQYLPDFVIPSMSLGYYTQDVSIRSFLAIPISQGEKIIGALIVDSLEQGAFSPDTQDLLVRFAPFFSQIIEKIQISQEIDLRAKNAAALHGMSAILNSSLELQEILSRLTSQMKIVVPYDFCVFLLYQEGSGEMEIAAQHGYDHQVVGRRFKLDRSAILNQMVEQWKKRSMSSSYDFPDMGKRGKDIELFPGDIKELQRSLQSLYCQPLVAREKFIGACIIGSVRPNAFTRYHKDFIDPLMNQVSMVIDNAILHQRIREMAHTDGLTGLLNHRTFMEKLEEEFNRLSRDPRSFSLLLLDIDHFKQINDKHGHPVGDEALKRIAGIIRETVRNIDFVGRYGGEEFAVGMVGVGADSSGAAMMAERIRKTVEDTTVHVGKITLNLKLSIGVAPVFRGCERKEELIARADKALYHAKRSGRNSVCLYEEMKDAAAPLLR